MPYPLIDDLDEISTGEHRRRDLILPSLFGEGGGIYEVRKGSFVLSYLLNTLFAALLLAGGSWMATHPDQVQSQVTSLVTDLGPYTLQPSNKRVGGGGGGGEHSKTPASKGGLPKASLKQQLAPPQVVRIETPKLPAEPTVIVPPQITLPQASQLGDPLAKALASMPSGGTGLGGGIGSGTGTGVGSGKGPGVGPGTGGGIGGGVYRVGAGVSPPRVVYDPDPDYSEEARKAKTQGTVVLWVIIGPDGRPRDITVQRSLGRGLDEKAVEAVRNWKFEPARKDGQAVAVQIAIEVNFRLY
ncbi:MAG: energy transducer TonB [Candidatus Korobacteraceae bacterium]|jgi:TonB family protein